MLFRFMQKCGLSSSRAYCIFLKSTNRNVQNVLLLKSWMGNWTKPLLLAGLAKIQYARDDERQHFCINLNKNIDSEVYCNANEFPNHLLY
jgi:protease II